MHPKFLSVEKNVKHFYLPAETFDCTGRSVFFPDVAKRMIGNQNELFMVAFEQITLHLARILNP